MACVNNSLSVGCIYTSDLKCIDTSDLKNVKCSSNTKIPVSSATMIAFVELALLSDEVFSSETLTINRKAGEGRGPSFIPLYHFHPLTNFETFICNFACEMTIMYF